MLPKIKHPIFEFVVPSTKKKELFRPFLTKEEKILLIAKTSEDRSEMLRAIKQVVNNCSINDSFDIDNLTLFDLEYLFLQIRAVSINNIVKVSYRDNEDNQVYDFEIDLTKVQVTFPEKIERKIMVDESVGILMKYPSASLMDDKQFLVSGENMLFELIIRCVDKIFDQEEVYDVENYTKEQLEEFLDGCGVGVFEKIQQFVNNTPKIRYELNYTNKMGNERKIVLDSLTDFFTLD